MISHTVMDQCSKEKNKKIASFDQLTKGLNTAIRFVEDDEKIAINKLCSSKHE